MELSNIAALASSQAQINTATQAQVLMLKKAMDIEQQSALALLEALPSPPSHDANLAIGRNLNVVA